MPTLFCATTNPDKVREFRHALEGFYSVEQLPGIAGIVAPEETGATFEENAVLKALYYSRHIPDPVFADDSGIEVDALGGAPGVFSARYAGPDASGEANNQLLLERMRGETNRIARFVCVIALASQGVLTGTFRGVVEGVLLDAPRGAEGFGYDPLFFYPPFGSSFGEAALAQKSSVSHRGQALSAMLTWLRSSSGNSR